MKELNIYPDFITIDGSEGSGATYKSMADYMGLPLIPALLTFIDTANHYGVRNKFKVFASGKLITPDKVAIVLAIGADAVSSARGFMMASGCIILFNVILVMSIWCSHDESALSKALDPYEKKWRVMNYIISMRYSLFSLAAAVGVKSASFKERAYCI